MSLVISLYVREGIVMASDSRLTINTEEKGKSVVNMVTTMTDSNYKTFLAFDRIGISTFGQAAIEDIPVAGFIESFIHQQEPNDSVKVEDVARDLLHFFRKFAPIPNIGFHVGGYDREKEGPVPRIYRVTPTFNQITLSNPTDKGKQLQGASWDGEGDVLARLIQPVLLSNGPDQTQEVPYFPIPWQIFTLQDAIDFAVFAIRTTIDSLRFQPRPKTVGGPIDVLVIKPEGAKWIARKELKIST